MRILCPLPNNIDPGEGCARVDKKDHILRYCGIKGDQAGSEASVGVGTCRSKRPVMSI
jgi:hypothetical protein